VKKDLSYKHIHFHSQMYIQYPIMLWPSKQYTKIGDTTHPNTYNRAKKDLSYNHIHFYSQMYIQHLIMLWPSKQYTKRETRLIQIHIISQIQWMLALVVDFPTLPSCSPELSVTMSQRPHTRLVLNGFWASATLTTRVSSLYVRLTDSLECQDATLSWILTKLYRWGTTMNSH